MRFALAFLLFELFELRFDGFFSVLVFEFDELFEFELLLLVASAFAFAFEGVEGWPSAVARLISTATV